jgi:glycosyltransferase involved in cell wall biosynthesis
MKILMCTLGYLPAVSWGGPVKIVHENAHELKRRGHDVSICASNRLDKSTYLTPGTKIQEVDGLQVCYLQTYMFRNWRGTAGPSMLGISAMRVLWNEIRFADIVHANGTRNAIVLTAFIFSYLQKKPFILQPHGTLPHIVSSVWLKKVFDKLFMGIILRHSTALIALQTSEREQILDAGGNPENVWIVPNGLSRNTHDVSQPEPGIFRSRYQIPNKKLIVLFLGRINPKKGVDLLVESYAKLPDSLKTSTQLVIAGPDDGQLKEVQNLIDHYQLRKNVTITGVLSVQESNEALMDADIFVLPARTDTFPMAIVEACAFGKPIVVTETCEIADILAGKAATIVPVNIKDISNAIQELLENAGLRQLFSQGALQLMDSEFSIQAVGDRLETIYTHFQRHKPE